MIKTRGTPLRRVGAAGLTAAALAVTGAAVAPAAVAADEPDFGPNVVVFDPSMSVDAINAALQAASHESEFSLNRHAFFFKPGTYGSDAGASNPATATGIVNSTLGYYMTVSGLGELPTDVHLNGAIHVEPVWDGNTSPWANQSPGSLTRFWRGLSNMQINPIQHPEVSPWSNLDPAIADAHQMRYAVSQAAPLRRIDLQGNLTLFGRYGEYASGGYMADSRVSGTVVAGSQQQWYTRGSQIGSWSGSVWNMVFSGVTGAPADGFPDSPSGQTTGNKFTTLASTPLSREAPFLTWSEEDGYAVFVSDARTDATGPTWTDGVQEGTSIPIADFFIADPSDSVASINAALASGKNLLLTPGVYDVDTPINVTHDDTVVLGLGMATLSPTAGNAVLTTGDVTGVKVAGITVDAATPTSSVLIQVGTPGATRSDAADPTTLSDVFVRIGGPYAGSVDTAIVVNSDGVLLDHIWSWRADHGAGAAWDVNTANHGLVVNGDDVTATGLFVEHYQKAQVVWKGNGGRTVFFQNELPYDPPSQAAWMDGDRKGYAAYQVDSHVTSHEAWGLGVYSYFSQGVDIRLQSGMVAPAWSTVKFHHAVTRFLNGSGGVDNVINDVGGAVQAGGGDAGMTKYVREYPPAGTPEPPEGIGDDQVSITTTVPIPVGEFGWTIDSVDRAVTLTEAVNAGAYLQSTGELVPVTVTDTRYQGPSWTISGQVSDFTDGLSGAYLGWTPTVTTAGAGATAGDAVASGIDGGDGLAVPSVLGSAAAGHAIGTATLGADLDLRVPVDTAPGSYTAVLTLTALS